MHAGLHFFILDGDLRKGSPNLFIPPRWKLGCTSTAGAESRREVRNIRKGKTVVEVSVSQEYDGRGKELFITRVMMKEEEDD